MSKGHASPKPAPPPRGVARADWESLICDLEDYRDRDPDDPYLEANEAAQSITEKCIKLLLPEREPKGD